MDKLKLVVSKPNAFALVDFSKYDTQIQDAIKECHQTYILQYLHGDLESEMGYDITLCLNAELCCNFEKHQYIDGVYEVEVVDYPNPCTAYLWTADGINRGLIVDSTDTVSVEFAKEKYKSKSYFL